MTAPEPVPSWLTVTWAGDDFGVVDHLVIFNGRAWRTFCARSRNSGLWADGARTNPEEWGHREAEGIRPRCKRCMTTPAQQPDTFSKTKYARTPSPIRDTLEGEQ